MAQLETRPRWRFACLAALGALAMGPAPAGRARWVDEFVAGYRTNDRPRKLSAAQCAAVIEAARALVVDTIEYDSDYYALEYPLGDVPAGKGVCADVLVRAFRAAGVDLQELVHRDMQRSFARYPLIWKERKPDTNIDHRRVPNLMTWFARKRAQLPLSHDAADYHPCDVVAWDLGGGVTHIGLVASGEPGQRPPIVHHISGHPTEEDVLFSWRLIGHFAY